MSGMREEVCRLAKHDSVPFEKLLGANRENLLAAGIARNTGPALSMLRNTAISLIRREGYPYMTAAWCAISAMPDFGLSLLFK